MKVKKIRIKSREAFATDLKKFARTLDKGQRPSRKKGENFFESLDAVRNVLTEKRLELWRTIRDLKPQTITELAKMVNRNFRAVHRDLLLLESVGLINLKEGKGKRGNTQTPVSLADELLLAVA
jgi:predicted transcriptional regulator